MKEYSISYAYLYEFDDDTDKRIYSWVSRMNSIRNSWVLYKKKKHLDTLIRICSCTFFPINTFYTRSCNKGQHQLSCFKFNTLYIIQCLDSFEHFRLHGHYLPYNYLQLFRKYKVYLEVIPNYLITEISEIISNIV